MPPDLQITKLLVLFN